jgi:hypothetical protein
MLMVPKVVGETWAERLQGGCALSYAVAVRVRPINI